MNKKRTTLAIALLAASAGIGLLLPARAQQGKPAPTASGAPFDWPMWGRTPSRNMITPEKDPPVDFDFDSGKNIKWKAPVGSKSYGNPVVAGGLVFCGSNNEHHYDPRNTADGGNLLVFRESDGKFLWQQYNAKLAAGRVNDWPQEGLCSTVYSEGDLIWYCTNRCEVVCYNVEALRSGEGEPKLVWKLDMMSKLGVFPHNMTASAPVAFGDLMYVITGNGVDNTHVNVPAPDAPAIICFNKSTGEVVWSSNAPRDNILHGQWSSVALASVNGRELVIAPLGDSWVYAFDAKSGEVVWKFDANLKNTVYPTTRNEIIATPVIYENRMYLSNGQDPDHGEGPGHLWCVDITKTGDISLELDDRPKPKPGDELLVQNAAVGKPNPNSGVVWHVERLDPSDKRPMDKIPPSKRINRTISSCCIDPDRNLVYLPDFSGFLHCFDARTGQHYWTRDLESHVWGSAMLADGKLYLCNEDGSVLIFESGKQEKLVAEHNSGSPIYSSPVFANGTMYVMNREFLYAISNNK